MFRKRKFKALDYFEKDCNRIDLDHKQVMEMRPRMKFLCEKFNDIIDQVDMFIMPRVTIKADMKLPDDFLCYCKIIGLRVKEVKENTSYSQNSRYYMSVAFDREVSKITCDEVSYL